MVVSIFEKTYFIFSISTKFIVISACSSLSASFLKSISGSRINALFLIAICLNSGVKVITKISVIFLFFQSFVFKENTFDTSASILTASCLFVSFDSQRI